MIRSLCVGPAAWAVRGGRALGSLAVGSFLLAGCTQTMSDHLQAMVDAHNAGHVEMVLSFYEADARIENEGFWVYEGLGQLAELFALQGQLHSRISLRETREQQDRVICDLEERNDLLALLGIEALQYRNVTAIFGERGIRRIRMRLGAESRKAHQRCLLEFVRWASEWRRGALEQLIVEGGPRITSQNFAAWLALLRDYRAEHPEGCQ